jgi:hypothetical protein
MSLFRRRGTRIEDKIKHTLEETRVVLPGTQALLGFQFAAVFQSGFSNIPALLQYMHLGSMGCVILSVMLLMMPASYHRIVEEGESTARFHEFTSYVLVTAMGFLALGLCGDLYVVVSAITKSDLLASGVSAVGLLLFFLTWYGYPLYKKNNR